MDHSTTQYRLKGAVHHSGGFNFGHYYCYNMVINSLNKPEWIKFNDNIVTRVEDQVEGRVPSEILTSDKEAVPYILAYQRIDRPDNSGIPNSFFIVMDIYFVTHFPLTKRKL